MSLLVLALVIEHIAAMLVFIDESGDPGLNCGRSPIFAVAMVNFEDQEAAQGTESVIRDAMKRLHVGPEFKFNKSKNDRRDGFFQAVQGCPFTVRAIVVQKQAQYYARDIKNSKESFYNFIVRQMLRHYADILKDAKINIDGELDRTSSNMFRVNIRRQIEIRDLKFVSSKNDPLVQLADMCVGAIARSYRADCANPSRWRDMLAPQIDDIVEFL